MKHWKELLIIVIATMLVSCATARIPVVNEEGKSPIVQVVKDTREAVVQIRVEAKVTVQNYGNPFLDNDLFNWFWGPQQPQQQQQRPVTSMGRGFVYDYNPSTREAMILTNNHVVENAKNGTIYVTLADKVTYTASLVGLDPNTDVAVIKIKVNENEKITVLKIGDSSKLEIGEWAIAIGNPFGDVGLDRTVTVGVISAIGRANLNFGQNSPIYQDYIQTDAAINPGNSGGPLLNINGDVIGINAAITSTSGGNIGIGFAIPINLAMRVVEDLVATGKLTRAYIGVVPQEITNDLKESFNLSEIAGVLVSKVDTDSPAKKAGLQEGDVIIEFNHEKVPNVPKFRIAVATAKIGVEVPIKVVRDNAEVDLTLVLEAYPEDTLTAQAEKNSKIIASGLTVENTDSQTARKLGISSDVKGVVVVAVEPNSPASKAGIEVGFVIQKIENKEVNTANEFKTELNNVRDAMEKSNRKVMRMYVMDKNKNPKYVVLRFE